MTPEDCQTGRPSPQGPEPNQEWQLFKMELPLSTYPCQRVSGEGPTADTKCVIWPKRLVQYPQLKAISKHLGVNKHRCSEGRKNKVRKAELSQSPTQICLRTLILLGGRTLMGISMS